MSGEAEAKDEPPDPPKPEEKSATSFDAETVNYIQNQMPGATIETAILGVLNGSEVRHVRATGRVMDGDIAEATSAYEPPECYAEAESALRKDFAVMLFGVAGVGKRTAALKLLRAMTSGELVLLSPEISISDLADRKFDQGTGYAVIDHIVDHKAGDSEFFWRVVCERLANAGSYLVLTATTEPPATSDAVSRLRWLRPDAERLLRKRMSGSLTQSQLLALTDTLANVTRVRDVVKLAERLDDGESIEAAVDHFDQTSRTAVCEWFKREPCRRQIVEITTLAFALGAGDRTFESVLASFERKLTDYMPEPESTEEIPAETSLPQRRHNLTGPDSLIVRQTVSTDLGPRSELVFAAPGYHRHVLAQLWDRMEVAFWDAVRRWLDELVVFEDQRVAFGLTRLAEIAFDEVLALLEPWSGGSRGMAGQGASFLVLSRMALDDDLAPVALLTASRWIASRDAARRWTAAMAFGGELGVRFPHAASNRLWQLCTQAHTTTGDASFALAQLFVTLVRETPDAGIVLTMLADKLARFGRPGGNRIMYAVAVAAALAALCAHDHVSNRRSFLVYLEQFPQRVDTIGRLWASVLRYRPTRLRAIEALRSALKDLADHDEQAREQVRQLGAALAAAMTDEDRARLHTDMRRVADRRDEIGSEALAALLSALLKALDRTEPPHEES